MAMTERGAAVPQNAQITPFGTAQKVTAIVRQDIPNGGTMRLARIGPITQRLGR